jgi:branched-chain amino acid transport system permease protein
MANAYARPCGDFRTSYAADTTIFADAFSRRSVMVILALLAVSPIAVQLGWLSKGWIDSFIEIGYLAVAALGLNILVGFTGQISIGHAVFFGFGAFASAWLNRTTGIPVFFCIPIAGVMTAAVGLIFGIPAARIKGLYLAIATLAAQVILEDFFARAGWFTGGVAGASAAPVTLFGWEVDRINYFYIVLFWGALLYLAATNLMRSRDGRAFVAVRDHYLAAEIMGINLTRYRVLSFGIAAFYAGVGGALNAHYLQVVSVEEFTILKSIEFLGMIIIGGLGSIMGTILGTVFMVSLPDVMDWLVRLIRGTWLYKTLDLRVGINFLKEMAVGIAIILFLIFEPDGLAHRWRQIKAWWKLYPFSY